MISWEVWADTCASSTEIVVIKKWVISVYNLETVKEEEALSSLIVWLNLACTTYLIWLRVSTTIVKRVLIRNKAVSLVQRVWIRCQAVQISGALVLRLYIKI